MIYLLLIGLGTLLLWAMSALLMRWLDAGHHQAGGPPLRHRIDEISEGNFAIDHAIEWSNELGDIGRGINHLAGNVEGLLARRLEDQKRKQDLEYQMLQTRDQPPFHLQHPQLHPLDGHHPERHRHRGDGHRLCPADQEHLQEHPEAGPPAG